LSKDPEREANYADLQWETVLPIDQRLRIEDVKDVVDAPWDRMQGSGVQLSVEASAGLEDLETPS
jgi:hypothetical protein